MNWYNFVSASEYRREHERKSLVEDTLEAFIGYTANAIDEKVTEGAGYPICYNIVESIFKNVEMSLDYDNLYDAVTRLKQTAEDIAEYRERLGKLTHKDERSGDERTVTYTITTPNLRLVGTGVACKKQHAKEMASEQAVQKLREMGMNETPKSYARCMEVFNS